MGCGLRPVKGSELSDGTRPAFDEHRREENGRRKRRRNYDCAPMMNDNEDESMIEVEYTNMRHWILHF